jgi:hypothetical protein
MDTKTYDLLIGIDPGTHNGVGVWNGRELTELHDFKTWELLQWVGRMHAVHGDRMYVMVEDPNTWVTYGTKESSAARAQGAGSVKRSFQVVVEYMVDHGIHFTTTRLQGNLKKVTKEYFNKLTGWTGKSTEHSRDGSMIVFNKPMTQTYTPPEETPKKVRVKRNPKQVDPVKPSFADSWYTKLLAEGRIEEK